MLSIQHTQTHPHGNFWTNKDHSIEFLRISKNGSTSFTQNLNLTNQKKFELSQINALKLGCFRNPYERFISSIPETLKRIALTKLKDDDVVVNQKIYGYLHSSTMAGSEEILDIFMSAITSFGFFDAHHEPQVHFLLNNDRNIVYDPQCFELRYMDSILQDLGGGSDKLNSRSSAQSPILQEKLKTRMKTRMKTLLGLLGIYKRDIFYQPFDKSSLQYAFLMKFEDGFNTFENHRNQLDYSLRKLYRDLKRHQDSKVFKEFIRQHYLEDIEVYQRLEIHKDLKSLPKFSAIYGQSNMS